MGKNKLRRFEENRSFPHLLQPGAPFPFVDHPIKGKWNETFFSKAQPLVLELGCGRGEYTVHMGRSLPGRNFIGVDIKGARIWRGAKTVHEEQRQNVGFLRIQIERLENFFSPGEVSEIWITFPDPQPQDSREKKRLTSPRFLGMYRKILSPGGSVHLKTDNLPLYEYTLDLARKMNLPVLLSTDDLYREGEPDGPLSIKTTYEKRFLEQGLKICYLQFNLL
jgi:tRNA (guanine-N7-)-methyltransferase